MNYDEVLAACAKDKKLDDALDIARKQLPEFETPQGQEWTIYEVGFVRGWIAACDGVIAEFRKS